MEVCKKEAMYRDEETGVVFIQEDKCTGCWLCVKACPYDAIAKNVELRLAVKCDLCPDQDIPTCVQACPTRALVYCEKNQLETQEE